MGGCAARLAAALLFVLGVLTLWFRSLDGDSLVGLHNWEVPVLFVLAAVIFVRARAQN
jgi:hypothetical protein